MSLPIYFPFIFAQKIIFLFSFLGGLGTDVLIYNIQNAYHKNEKHFITKYCQTIKFVLMWIVKQANHKTVLIVYCIF